MGCGGSKDAVDDFSSDEEEDNLGPPVAIATAEPIQALADNKGQQEETRKRETEIKENGEMRKESIPYRNGTCKITDSSTR